MIKREPADGQRKSLASCDTAHAGYNRHQYGERHDLIQGLFEKADDPSRNENRQQVDPEPYSTPLEAWNDWGEQVFLCFEAGALATGCEVAIVLDTAYTDLRSDEELAGVYQRRAESLGRVFVEPPAPVSTDMGNVSYEVPTIHPFIGVESGGAVPHQAEFADACATPSADQAIFDGALAMALTVIDMATDESVRSRLLGE